MIEGYFFSLIDTAKVICLEKKWKKKGATKG